MHVRSSSDTSEINLLVRNNCTDGLTNEPRSPTGETFSALIRKFEQKIQNENHVHTPGQRPWYYDNENQDFVDGFRSKSGGNSATGSPLIERRTPALKRKNSLRNNTYFARVFKGSGDAKAGEEEYADEPSRKYFAHYDCNSMMVDFEELALQYAQQGDGLKRKNKRSGASAASTKITAATIADKMQRRGSDSSASTNEEDTDYGDNKSNSLVLNCPYFRNELGGQDEQDPQIGLTRGNVALQNSHDPSCPKEPRLDNLRRRSTLDILLTAYDSARVGNLSSGTGVTILDNSKPESGVLYLGEGLYSENGCMFEHVDHGSYYYKNFFIGQEHLNYLGIDERFGPIALSLKREKLDDNTSFLKPGESEGNQYQYRIIVRTSELTTLRGSVLEEAIPSTSRHGAARALPAKDILGHVCPELQLSALKMAQPGVKVPEQLMKLDEQGMTNQYKVGVLYCREGQSTEEEMYNNQISGPAFEEFLDLLGSRVSLKGFEGYRAQLDNRNDSTGEHSVYTQFHGREIMFHVSTLLPWTPNNRQQLLRKRHIGNDIVTIVFQEPGALPFTPKNIRSHFQHVFIVIRVFNPCSDNTYYKVAVSRSKDVPPFGPNIPVGAKFGKQRAFADFLLTKVINAENAAHKSDKFSAMATRTRHEYLKDLAINYVTNTTLETGAKGKGILRSTKKKEKVRPPISPEKVSLGALVWNVQVEDYRNSSMIDCKMGVSADTLVLVHSSSKEVIFSIPAKSVIGWTSLSQSIKVFYGTGDCLVLNIPTSDSDDIPEIVRRLEEISIGCQTQTITLRRNMMGQLGFHVQFEGLIADVEPSGFAWMAGLRQGSRLVEINGMIVATLSHEQMIDFLRKPGSVSAVIVPPFQNGKPRKGIQPVIGSSWSVNRASVTTISSFGSSSSVAEEPDLREQSALSFIDGVRKQTPKVFPKNSITGQDSPWIMRTNNGTIVDIRATYSGSRPSDPPESPRTSSTSSATGSSQTLHETPRQPVTTYGASYTVTSVTPNGERHHGHPDAYGAQKWDGFAPGDPEPRSSKPVGVTLKASTASGTLYAIASGPPSPQTPHPPDYAIFGSTAQRHRGPDEDDQGVGNTRFDGARQDTRLYGDGYGVVRVNVDSLPSSSEKRNSQQEIATVSAEGTKETVPFKETSLGAVITTVNTYKQKQSYEDITEASMSETVDQIEKAFGFRTPDMVGNGTGSLERNGSLRRPPGERSPRGSMQDIHLTPRRAQSGESLNRNRSSEDEDSPGNILKRLTKETNEQDRLMHRKSEGDLPHNLFKAKSTTPTAATTTTTTTTTTVVEASPHSVEVKTEMKRKSEYEARLAARNLLIERLGNRQTTEGGPIEGIKIYHAKSRSTPADGRKLSGEKNSRQRQSSQDDSAKVNPQGIEYDGAISAQHAKRIEKQHSGNVRTPDYNRASAKPVVRSERRIRLTSSSLQGADGSQTVPRQSKSSKRRNVSGARGTGAGNSDSSDEELRMRSGDRVDIVPTTAGKLQVSPERNKKSSSLPREWERAGSPHGSTTRESRESRNHRSRSHLRNARITKIKMSANEEPIDSIVDQTARLLSAAKAVKFDKRSSPVVADDVMNSLTRTSELLQQQSTTAREEREMERRDKDRSLSRIKAPGRGRSHGPHKFYIPVVPRRHSFDERIFAAPSAKGNSGESLLTRESIGKEAELEMKLAIVSNALMKEGEEKHRLDSEFRKLQKENKRLQEDLRTASHQLRKFTEWFFSTMEQNKTC
ncbi:PREDICTED: signal-induced proliferation-associated 1-like protein 1 isoform X3 [Acropora digitifera]|nr:PREDICTED: signal-induced proliferation-associated 1-like protein 1 isoform X3 [Acropora digitifera]